MYRIPTNADCIIYNACGTGTSKRYIKHVLRDVFWDEVKQANAIEMGTTTANSIFMAITLRDDYVNPLKWKTLFAAEIMSLKYFTLQKGDVLILGTPDCPDEFSSTVKIGEYFGTDYIHLISSVDAKLLPDKSIHHFEIGGK